MGVAIYSLAVAVLALFLAVIIYPTSVSKEMAEGPNLDGGRVQSVRFLGDMDFDNDGIMDHIDDDDDNDGISDEDDDDDDTMTVSPMLKTLMTTMMVYLMLTILMMTMTEFLMLLTT